MNNFYCVYCDYNASSISKFQRHNASLKHLYNKKNLINNNITDNKLNQEIINYDFSFEENNNINKELNQEIINYNKLFEQNNNIIKNKSEISKELFNKYIIKCFTLEKRVQTLEKKLQNNKKKYEILEKELKIKDEKYDSLVNKLASSPKNVTYKQCSLNILNNANNIVKPLHNIDFLDILDKYMIKTNNIDINNLPKKKCEQKDCDGKCNKKYICPSKYLIQKKLLNLCKKTNDFDACSDYITEAITNYYKENDNTKLLPIINTDTSRNTYFLKIKDINNEIWINDKKGIKLIDIVIKPFINYIIILLNDFDNYISKNILNNKNTLVFDAFIYFENELLELKKNKPIKKNKLKEYKEQKQIYLEYLNIFKNYKDNTTLINDLSNVLDICFEHCSHIYEQFQKKNLQFSSDKVLVAEVSTCLKKTTFVNTILTNLAPHFYKTHDNILEIVN